MAFIHAFVVGRNMRRAQMINLLRRYGSSKKDEAIPFLNSPASRYKLIDLSGPAPKGKKYALPAGLGLFVILMYMCFIRDYKENDEETCDTLTKKINDYLTKRFPVTEEQTNNKQKELDRK